MLTSAEVRGKWVLSVEDWAEIRRLYRAERMPIKAGAGVFEEYGQEGAGRGGAASVSTAVDRLGGGCGGAAASGVAAGLPDDAGHGDRGTD